ALGRVPAGAEAVGGHQPVPRQRRVVDLLGDEPAQHARALRVADEHEAPAVAQVDDVLLEGVEHVAVGDLPGVLAEPAADGRQRGLPVDRGEHPAAGGQAGGLVADGRDLLGLARLPVAVGPLVVAGRRVDVEAVDGRVLRHLVLDDLGRAVGLDDGGVEVGVLAHVVGDARLAQPVGVVGVALARVALPALGQRHLGGRALGPGPVLLGGVRVAVVRRAGRQRGQHDRHRRQPTDPVRPHRSPLTARCTAPARGPWRHGSWRGRRGRTVATGPPRCPPGRGDRAPALTTRPARRPGRRRRGRGGGRSPGRRPAGAAPRPAGPPSSSGSAPPRWSSWARTWAAPGAVAAGAGAAARPAGARWGAAPRSSRWWWPWWSSSWWWCSWWRSPAGWWSWSAPWSSWARWQARGGAGRGRPPAGRRGRAGARARRPRRPRGRRRRRRCRGPPAPTGAPIGSGRRS